MAADWVKMRTDLYRHPKVCIMAERLEDPGGGLAQYVNQNCQRNMTVTRNVMRNVTVGALVTVWGVMRNRGERRGDNLVLAGATIGVIDDVAEVPGFGEAMEAVEWVEETDAGLVFPRFFSEHNADPQADKRAKNAERQQRYRDKRSALRNVAVTPKSNARQEREIEEEKNPPSPPVGGNESDTEAPPAKTRRKRRGPDEPRPRNALFDAVAEVTGSDPALTGSALGKVSAALAKATPPYTPDEVREFGRRFHEFCPWAAKDHRARPTPTELQKHIGLLRAGKPKSSPTRPGRTAADIEAQLAADRGPPANPNPGDR